LVIGGILLLFLMAFLFKGGNPTAPHGMQPEWWGILGIIGWAYLVCATIFLLTKGNLSFLLSCLAIFILINISTHLKLIDLHLFVIGDASSVTLVMAGMAVAGIYEKMAGKGNDASLWLVLTSSAVFFILAGFFIRPFSGGISKIHATPACFFICTGISLLIFEILVWLIDIKDKRNWFHLIRPGGTSTLTCYLVPYFLYSIFSLIHFNYPAFLNQGIGGLIRSFAIGFLVIGLVGFIEKYRLRLKI